MPKTAALTLTAFRAAALERADGEPPSSLLVHPWGAHDVGKRGKSIVSAKTLDTFSAGQAALKLNGRVALDFRHNTVPGMPAYLADKEPRKVAAYGVPELRDGQGLYLTALEWTPEGKDAFMGGHFQDISPAVFRDKDGNVMAIHSAALCDHGEIDGLTIEAATAPTALSAHFAALTASLSPSQSSPMKPTPELIALLAALGTTLAPDADEATVAATLTDLTTKIKADMAEDKSAGITALTAGFEARLAKVEAERDSAKRDRLKESAVNAGKVIPLDDATWDLTPLSVCEAIVKNLQPGVVPMTAKTTKEVTAPAPDAFSAHDAEVFGKFGLTKEDFEKYGPDAKQPI